MTSPTDNFDTDWRSSDRMDCSNPSDTSCDSLAGGWRTDKETLMDAFEPH